MLKVTKTPPSGRPFCMTVAVTELVLVPLAMTVAGLAATVTVWPASTWVTVAVPEVP